MNKTIFSFYLTLLLFFVFKNNYAKKKENDPPKRNSIIIKTDETPIEEREDNQFIDFSEFINIKTTPKDNSISKKPNPYNQPTQKKSSNNATNIKLNNNLSNINLMLLQLTKEIGKMNLLNDKTFEEKQKKIRFFSENEILKRTLLDKIQNDIDAIAKESNSTTEGALVYFKFFNQKNNDKLPLEKKITLESKKAYNLIEQNILLLKQLVYKYTLLTKEIRNLTVISDNDIIKIKSFITEIDNTSLKFFDLKQQIYNSLSKTMMIFNIQYYQEDLYSQL